MKKKLPFSMISIIISACFILAQFNLTSCTKETAAPPVTLTNTQVLTKNAWMVDECWQVISGTSTYYKRGGINTTGNSNYSAFRLTFKTDGTGTNTISSTTTYPMIWGFTSTDERNMKLTVNGTAIYNWSLVKISESEIIQTTSFGQDLNSVRWIPAP